MLKLAKKTMSSLKKAEAVATKFNKVLLGLVVIAVLCVVIFGKKTHKSDEPTITYHAPAAENTSSTSQTDTRTINVDGYPVNVDMKPPNGYERGLTCSDCDGVGVINFEGKETVCANCMGKGFKWHRKSTY